MKRISFLFLWLVGLAIVQVPSMVWAQPTGPSPPIWWTNLPPVLRTNLPPDWANQPPVWTNLPAVVTNLPAVWTNILRGLRGSPAWVTNMWWTNVISLTNLPPAQGKSKTHGVIGPGAAPAPDLPKDVQSLLDKFQKDSKDLMNSLQEANDANRQQILQQLQQLRDQLKAQLQEISQQARDQALDMRSKFGGNFAPGNAAGGTTMSGHGGRPRP